jgi:4-hydroxybenzoate polyprenyltransferase
MNDKKIPLCVDLDGTLIRTDLLFESLLVLVKQKPWLIFLIPWWLLRGKSALKAEIADRVDLDAQSLPYQAELLEFLKSAHAEGRPLVLATASHRKFADAVAQHLGLFTDVHATEGKTNLSGENKGALLARHYGVRGFDYAGNGRTDIPVWKFARHAIVVNPGAGVLEEAQGQCPIKGTFTDRSVGIKGYARALRVHQWLKNLLVFVPMLLAHQIYSLTHWINAVLAFFSFSLCASSVYLLNDLLDLPADRQHPRKRSRPFASGTIPILHGILLIPLLLLAAFGVAVSALPSAFVAVLGIYYLITVSYSFWLKAVVLLDALLLAGLYTIRIIGGAAATQLQLSFWLLAFSIFLFFSLALVKRYSELLVQKRRGQLTAHGRGYHVEDLVMLMGFGVASGFVAVLVSALYVNSTVVTALYRHPIFLWLVSPLLLFWISRIWLITHRGEMHDDPVVFAATDKGSWVVAVIIGGLLWLAAL